MDKDKGRARRRRTIAAMAAGTAVEISAEEQAALRRTAARVAWVNRTCAAWREAMDAADAAWMELLEPYDDWDEEEVPELDPPPEQELVDRLWQQLDDVRRHDRWPRHLHWSL